MLKRKFRKLVNNPKLFFSDMAIKHSDKISYLKPKKMEGHYQYTVVSAVYNVGRYLEDYFESLVKQRLDFKKHIQIILVDDGSTDNSADIIKKWQKKYPNNITYIYKQNGGQASARNIGLQNVKSGWVTFIDSDDFVSPDYFLLVDELLVKNSSINMVCCNQIYYFEDENKYIDRHPLNYRFEAEKTILPSDDLGRFMQFSAPLAFFNTKYIPEQLRFDERLKPTFEDGKFVSHYIMGLSGSDVCFYAKPKYYNRKRMDKSSTMDNAWYHKGQYDAVLKYGYIETFKSYLSSKGYVPKYFQRTILWEMLRLVKQIVNKEENVSFLSHIEKSTFLSLMDEVFSYIDSDTILSYELGSCGFSRQVGMLGCFKNEKPKSQVAYIDRIDHNKKQALVRYFTCHDPVESFILNENEVYPIYEKTVVRTFISRTFLKERRLWIPISNGRLDIFIDDKPAIINFMGKKFKGSLNISEQQIKRKNTSHIWLLMDRDDMAGDNAEFLYGYISREQPQIDLFFILNKNSPDWNRLEKRGFKLVEHGSNSHKNLLKKCSKVISSHVGTITNPFEDIDTTYLTVFLQHGVTKDNISNWINNCHFDLMITSTNDEHREISGDFGKYIYGEKEIKLTGFPRFDSLLDAPKSERKQILIMPTWRKNIAGSFVSKGSSQRVLNKDFKNTNYAKKISSLLSNESLVNICRSGDVDIVFCPHPNMKPYIKELSSSRHVKIASESQSIHELIKESSMLITDYSSVAFDVAYMNKPVAYYQFDEEEFFGGAHTYSKGYFEYRRDGFGPVINHEDDLVTYISDTISSNFVNQNSYSDRVTNTFPFRDKSNCQRVFHAINDLSMSKNEYTVDIDSLIKYAYSATMNKSWVLSEERWKKVQQITDSCDIEIKAMLFRVEALRSQGQLHFAERLLSDIKEKNVPSELLDLLHLQQAKLSMCRHRWHSAIEAFRQVSHIDNSDYIEYIKSLSELKWHAEIKKEISSPNMMLLDNNQKLIVDTWILISYSAWKKAINSLQERICEFSFDELKYLVPELIVARCCREVGDINTANKYLSQYESHTRNNPICREEIASLAYSRGNWDKAVSQIKQIYSSPEDLPDEMAFILVNSLKNQISDITLRQNISLGDDSNLIKVRILREQGKILQADVLMEGLISESRKEQWSIEIFTELARLAMAKENWQEAISYWEQCAPYDNVTGMARIRCLAELRRYKAIKRALLDSKWFTSLSKAEALFAESFYHIARCEWLDAIKLLSLAIPQYETVMLMTHKPELWLAHCLREQGLYIESHNQLENYEKHTKSDPQCRIQIAKLAMVRGDMKKTISQIQLAYPDSVNLPESIALILVNALKQTENFERASQIISTLSSNSVSRDGSKKTREVSIAHIA